MLDLKTLQNAFSKIEEVGKGELTFDLDGIPVTLRVLLPSEEITVQKFAAQAMAEGDDTDASTTADYLERFKQAVCSHALVAVGELDFRGVEFVETGETLDNGVAIKVPKHQAVRDILSNFSRGATTIIFKKYGELLAQVEQDAEAATDFEIPDLDAEIKRLQDRITELEQTKAEEEGEASIGVMDSAVNTAIKAQGEDYERAKEWGDELRSQQQEQADADRRVADLKKAAQEGLRTEEEEPSEEAAPTTRQPVSPTHAAPPLERQDPPPEMTREEVLAKVEEMSSEEPPPQTFSSQNTFIGDDPDSQLQAENERMAQVRAARAKQKQQDQLRRQETAVSPARKAPHLAAKEVADQMAGKDAVVQVGSIDGIPAYSMGEPQELHDKVGGGGQKPPVVDQGNIKKGTVNPRFRQPK
jgi:hypothetical protein